MYVTARAVTDGRGRTISGGDIYGLLKTVDLSGTKVPIWREDPESWLNGFTVGQVLDLSDMDRKILRYEKLSWVFKYNQICYHLKYNGVDMSLPCSVCAYPRRLKVIIVGNKEYRARGCIIHERDYQEESNDL